MRNNNLRERAMRVYPEIKLKLHDVGKELNYREGNYWRTKKVPEAEILRRAWKLMEMKVPNYKEELIKDSLERIRLKKFHGK